MAKKYIDAKWHYPQNGEYPVIYGEYEHKHYPQIPCLVFYHGMYGVRFWNCTEECWDDEECDDFYCSKEEVEKWMYIDSLEQPQLPADVDSAMAELQEKIDLVSAKGTWKGVDVDKYMDEIRGREPIPSEAKKDLREELDAYVCNFEGKLSDEELGRLRLVAEHFYLCGENPNVHLIGELPSDVEEAAKEYGKPTAENWHYPSKEEAFKAGVQWRDAQTPKLPDDVEEAANSYWNKVTGFEPKFTKVELNKKDFAEVFKAGAAWYATKRLERISKIFAEKCPQDLKEKIAKMED